MVTLTVLQQGNITYESGDLTMQFDPAYIVKLLKIGSTSQFVYYGQVYIVDELAAVIFAATNYIELAEMQEDNVTQTDVAFNLGWVQSVQDIDGYAGVIYALNPDSFGWRATSLSVSTTNTDFATVDADLEAAGFVRVAVEENDDTTRDFYLNLNGVANASTYTPDAPTTYTLPDGTQLVGYSLYTYTVNFTGIAGADTIDTITTGLGTLTLNLPCVSAANRTAIAAAITAYLLAAGAEYGTVAVTSPGAGKLRIVIPTTNVVFVDATCTISATPTTEDFVIT